MDQAAQQAETPSEAHRSQGETTQAKSELVLSRLLAAHEAWFDVYRDREVAGRMFCGFAEFHSHGAQYVLVKRAKLWEADEHEYILFDIVDRLTEARATEDAEFMKTKALSVVKLEPNHMSSNLSLVVIANSVDDAAAQVFRKLRFRKNYAFGFKGWSDVRMACIDLSKPAGSRVTTNGAGKTLRETLEANASLGDE